LTFTPNIPPVDQQQRREQATVDLYLSLSFAGNCKIAEISSSRVEPEPQGSNKSEEIDTRGVQNWKTCDTLALREKEAVSKLNQLRSSENNVHLRNLSHCSMYSIHKMWHSSGTQTGHAYPPA